MRIKSWKRQLIAVFMTAAMIIGMVPSSAFADSSVVKIDSAGDLPAELQAGVTYELTSDITLADGQQIETLAGVLDGKGYTITLADKPLANNVTGTVQNLGVKGSRTVENATTFGSIAVKLSGTIQNSYSLVSVKLNDSTWTQNLGGMVGTLSGGCIKNSYFGGSINPSWEGGIAGYIESGEISNTRYTTSSCYGFGRLTVNDNNKKVTTIAEAVEALNTNITDSGFKWEVSADGTAPELVENTGQTVVNKTALNTKIEEAKALDESLYTESSWNVLKAALSEAESVYGKEDASQEEVNAALSGLETAYAALEKIKPAEPVAVPEDESEIVHITNQYQLESIGAGDKDKYYVLDNDIVTDGWYMCYSSEFNGTFDGQGHSITFKNDFTGLFKNVGSDGVVQNVHFKGTLKNEYGACGLEIRGAVINCYSEISGDNAAGFAKRLNGGIISNCYSISSGAKGAVVTEASAANTGTLKNVYWQKDLKQPADMSQLTIQGNTGALSAATMKTLDFVAALNENKGEYGVSWGQNSNGYPYFGENLEYVPETEVPLPDNAVEMTFTPNGSDIAETIENQELTVDKNLADGFGVAGVLSLAGYTVPDGARVEWSCSGDAAAVNMDEGELFVYEEGAATVTATLIKADGLTEVLSTARVTITAGVIEAIKLYIADGNGDNAVEVENGTAAVKGSADHRVVVKAKYEGESIYKTVSIRDFTFVMSDPDGVAHHTADTSVFYFKKPGTATMTVTSKANETISADAVITSEYVAVESVKPGIEGTVVLHGRNANSTDKAYLPTYAGVVVTPANASYAGEFTVTSSDPKTAEYVSSMVVGYVPYKAGTVTYTATVNDNGTEKSGTSEVTYVYKNPLTAVTSAKSEFILKEGESASAELTFTGTTDEYMVTETGMEWSFDKEGIVKIVREEGGFTVEDGEKLYFLGSEYTIHGLAEGTVTVTGNPVDNTAGAEPVTFTVTVVDGNLQPADIDKIISTGIGTASGTLGDLIESSPEFGSEWNIVALLRAGKTIDEKLLNQYYESVAATVKEWDNTAKPTEIERTVLALAAMGMDVTDVDGVDLAAMIYNHEDSGRHKITNGSNEAAYALIALDAAEVEVPADAVWTRDKLVEEVLKYQGEEGFFGLHDNKAGSIDMTCICLQALAPYAGEPDVAAAIEKGLEYLKNKIDGNYGYGDSNATAQVLLTLSVLGIDVTDSGNGFGTLYSNIITNLDEYRTDAGFEYMKGNGTDMMATYQVMQAFDAYRKAQKEGISYWDFAAESAGYDDDESTVGPDGPSSDETTDVYVTIAVKGTLEVTQEEIAVTDIDKDGSLTINDALYIAHEDFYTGGAAEGYGSAQGSYGFSLTKLWGDESGLFGYYVNNASAWSLADPVEDGDYIYAFVYANGDWSDKYSWFDKNTAETKAGESVELTLYTVTGYDAENNWAPITGPVAGAVIMIDGEVTDYVTDENGKVAISFAEAGEYVISAKSENMTLVPPVCVATVTAADEDQFAEGGVSGGNDAEAQDQKYNAVSVDKTDKTTQTGDDFNMMLFAVIALAALATAIAVSRRRYNN